MRPTLKFSRHATRFTTNALNGLNCAGKRLKVIMKEVIEKFGMDTQGNGSGVTRISKKW